MDFLDPTLDLESEELKANSYETEKRMCRACLCTEHRMVQIKDYIPFIIDLTTLTISESDGMPQWLCYQCVMLLQKSVKFKHKILKANSILYEYLTRCLPFPIDADDPELSKYASPYLNATNTLTFDNEKDKNGYHKVLQHEKVFKKSELDVIELPNIKLDDVKDEGGFSDFEDNVTLSEYRSNIKPDDTEDMLEVKEAKVKKKTKKKDGKLKKKKSKEDVSDVTEPKMSVRKAIDLDPTKIRIITLDPEEQLKQREAASKVGLKFPYQCNLCYKGFNFENKLQNHMKKHSSSRGKYECTLCQMFLPTAFSYSVHWLTHTRRYECVKCGRRMTNRVSILDHYRNQHEGLTTLYTCQICGKVSNNSKTHRGHLRNHHSGGRPECDQCGKTFINKDSLAEHMLIHRGVKNYECPICGKRVRTRTQIKQHQLIHTDVKLHYCVECDVRFKSVHGLRQHLRKSAKHRDDKSLSHGCSRCDKRFDSELALEQHNRIQHEGIREHPCNQCGAALASANSLKTHIAAVHAGRRPPRKHVCDTCGRAFRGKSVLTNHVRTHTGEKPFECGECGRKFAQRTAMRTHVQLVHLKMRRNAKIKPEVLVPREPPLEMFSKEEPPIFDNWPRGQPCDMYYRVTSGS